MSSYFSDRHSRTTPRAVETISPQTWAGILSLLEARVTDGSLAFGFPAECQDGGAIYGTDQVSLWDRALAEIPRLLPASEEPRDAYSPPWRPRRDEVPPTDAVLDLCVLIARNIGQPKIVGSHHTYYGHDHIRLDREEGLIRWVQEVNGLFARAGLAYEMAADGTISSLLPGPLLEAIAQTEFATGDAAADALLERAVALLSSRHADAHQDAIEKLWDAFERIKTLEAGDKKQGAETLLSASQAPDAPLFNEAVRNEFRLLTDLGNKLRIRHSETDKEPISSRRKAEYLFHRMFALLRYVLLQTDRIRRS